MTGPQSDDMEELALLAELARPLVHECNNFLNNLFLQMAISQNDLPEFLRADWERVRLNGKRLSGLLQEWQSQPRSILAAVEKTAVLPLIQEVVRAINSTESPVQLNIKSEPQPAWLAGSAGQVKRLFCLALRHAIAELEVDGNPQHALEIQFERAGPQIIFRIYQTGPSSALPLWADFDSTQPNTGPSSLLVAACKSLTERLEGSLAVERHLQDRRALVLKLPGS